MSLLIHAAAWLCLTRLARSDGMFILVETGEEASELEPGAAFASLAAPGSAAAPPAGDPLPPPEVPEAAEKPETAETPEATEAPETLERPVAPETPAEAEPPEIQPWPHESEDRRHRENSGPRPPPFPEPVQPAAEMENWPAWEIREPPRPLDSTPAPEAAEKTWPRQPRPSGGPAGQPGREETADASRRKTRNRERPRPEPEEGGAYVAAAPRQPETRPETAEAERPSEESTPTSASAAAAIGAASRSRGAWQRAEAKDGLVPPYPLGSRRRGEEGLVLVAALIDSRGKCLAAELEQSSGFAELDAAALETVGRASFRPARRDGRPAPARERFAIEFRLRDE